MDEDKIHIVLRDHTAKPFFAAEVEDEGFDFEPAMHKFLEKAKALPNLVLDGHRCDIIISYWGQQGDIKLSQDFVMFAGNHGLPIEICFND